MKAPRPEDCAVVMGADDLHEIDRVRRATPTVPELADRLGLSVRKEVNAFGRSEDVATITSKEQALAVSEAMREANGLDTARQSQLQAKRPTEELRDAQGRRRKVWNIHAEQVAETQGLKPAWSKGRASFVYRDGAWWKNLGGGKRVREDPPSRMSEILESGQAPVGYVH